MTIKELTSQLEMVRKKRKKDNIILLIGFIILFPFIFVPGFVRTISLFLFAWGLLSCFFTNGKWSSAEQQILAAVEEEIKRSEEEERRQEYLKQEKTKEQARKNKLRRKYVSYRTTKVKGTSFRNGIDKLVHQLNDNLGFEPYDGLTGEELKEEAYFGEVFKYSEITTENVELVPEPDNPVDENALKVVVEGVFIGYIDKNYAKFLKSYINVPEYGFDIIATLSGGPSKYYDDFYDKVVDRHRNFSCKLEIGVKKIK